MALGRIVPAPPPLPCIVPVDVWLYYLKHKLFVILVRVPAEIELVGPFEMAQISLKKSIIYSSSLL